MDLQSEASGTRVLTARHISPDKTLPHKNDAVNTTLLCHSYTNIPHFASYFNALQPYAWILWTCGLIILLATIGLYIWTLRSRDRSKKFASLAVVLAVYPVVTACAFIVLVVPRARLVSEAVAQQWVMVAMYHLFSMILDEAGGPEKLVSQAGESRLETRVPPCCCWPCCLLPRPTLHVKSLNRVRYLVLQVPIVQAVIYVIALVLWVEDYRLYSRGFTFLQPFVAASILSGMWGVIMTVKLAYSAGYAWRPRFLAWQLVLIIVKLQLGFAKILSEFVSLPCVMDVHPAVVVHMITFSIVMVEMLLLSIWAWRLYRVAPEKSSLSRVIAKATIEDGDQKNGGNDIIGGKNKDGGDINPTFVMPVEGESEK